MTRSNKRAPLSEAAWRVLRAVKQSGGTATPETLLDVAQGSWQRLLGSISVLERRGLVKLRPGVVVLTRDGLRAVASRFAH